MAAAARGGGRDRERWRVGVDLGGTWVRVIARSDRGARRRVRTRSPGLDALPAFLHALWTRWRLGAADVAALVAASRGVWTEAERRRHRRRLRLLARRVAVLSDAEAAYHAALGDGPGLLLLAGTGSMVLGRDARGRWARAGGLGPLLGDQGSAFWIGREWLARSGREADQRRARLIAVSPAPVARIAALAPGVLRRARAGSPRARAIVARGQRALAGLLVAAARRLSIRRPVAVSWGGSLLEADDYRAGVWRAARRLGLAIAPRPPAEAAADAALRLAAGLRGATPARARAITRRPRGRG